MKYIINVQLSNLMKKTFFFMTHLVSIWENAAELTTAGTLTWWQPPKQNKRGHQR